MPNHYSNPNFPWEGVDSWLDAQIKTTNYSKQPAYYLAQAQRVFNLARQKYNLQLPESIVTVAGTNGKGSTVLLTAELLAAGGHSVATLTSPHLDTVANRMQFFNTATKQTNQRDTKTALLTDSICDLMDVEGYQQLGWYQKVTLACLVALSRQNLDFWVLEVGLGGRYDAIRVVQCNIAVVTTIADDHLEKLGPTMEDLAKEKAGICIGATTAMYFGDEYAEIFQQEFLNNGVATMWIRGININLNKRVLNKEIYSLALSKLDQPQIKLQVNHSLPDEAVTAAVLIVEQLVGINIEQFEDILLDLQITGRLQKIGNVLFDVSHNVSSVARLTEYLQLQEVAKKSLNVLLCLKKTKDLHSILTLILPYVNHWHLYSIDLPNFYSTAQFSSKLEQLNVSRENITMKRGLPPELSENNQHHAKQLDWLVFGSFLLVGPALSESYLNKECLDLQLTMKKNINEEI